MARSPRKTPLQTTGATPTTPGASNGPKSNTVASVIGVAAATGTPQKSPSANSPAITRGRPHQTHGAVIPTGPITNVSQLLNGGRNVAKGSAGSFGTMEEYTAYLKTLSLGDLHQHAVSERTVPIDDRDRLIRRLETAWTGAKARYPGSAGGQAIPRRAPFTQEQMAIQQELQRKLLRR